jgi:hypothetical protein
MKIRQIQSIESKIKLQPAFLGASCSIMCFKKAAGAENVEIKYDLG